MKTAMREAWTDGRMDDLNHKVNEGFRRVETDVRELRTEMNARFDALQRVLIIGVVALSSAFVAGFAALVGLFATQI